MVWHWLVRALPTLGVTLGPAHCPHGAALFLLLLAVQLIFHPQCCLLTQSIALQSDYKDILGDHSEGLTKVRVYNILCSPLVYRTSHPILEDNEVGQERFALGKSVLAFPIMFYSFMCLEMLPGGFALKPSVVIRTRIQLYIKELVIHIAVDTRRHRPVLCRAYRLASRPVLCCTYPWAAG